MTLLIKEETKVELQTIDVSGGSLQERERIARRKEIRRRAQEKQRRLERRRRHRRKVMAARISLFISMLCLIFGFGFGLYHAVRNIGIRSHGKTQVRERETFLEKEAVSVENTKGKPLITEDFLTPNPYSRPGEKLPEVKNIFVHYTANQRTSAAQNRSYFENLGITGETSASAHFVIGYEGEIIQCIPLDEIAYAVVGRNYDSISIECCYLEKDGKFTDATYQSLLKLCGWLLKEYDLSLQDMRRHYDEGGKKCPLYYVEHEEEWDKFLSDLNTY